MLVYVQVVTSGADCLLEQRSMTVSLGESFSPSCDALVFTDSMWQDRHLSIFGGIQTSVKFLFRTGSAI